MQPKKKEIPPFVTCMNLKDIMLGEISQSQKDKYCIPSLIHGIFKKAKFIEESRLARDDGVQGMGEMLVKEYTLPVIR